MNPLVAPAHIISGCCLKEQLYAGSRTVVYRAIRQVDDCPIVIKLLCQDYPSFSDLLQFRNQYAIAKHLDNPGIVAVYSLEPHGNGYALIMEDFGGISLKHYSTIQPLSLLEILAIAVQLADILHDLSQHSIIHKDIKPANILIHPETKQVKLIDFSIASLLLKETQDIKSLNELEGTLAYLAPEQTGRMNRGIDYRSDFYALGVTLFELLTGMLPFQATDPMELVHCHLAKQPPSVLSRNSAIPQVLSNIVSKLMAKNAEDRYQSALGLKHDLQICLEQLQTTSSITPFDLGSKDRCDRFLIPEKLYGRAAEVQTLLDAFSRVAEGASEMMLVAGFSGIGKTAVVNEVHKPMTRQRGYFIKGKFDQLNRNVPLSAFLQALRDLLEQLLSESDFQRQNWKTKILEAIGETGQILIEVLPELERLIGPQPQPPGLEGSAAQNRFNRLLQAFIAVFTTAEHPLVLFLDDLQWADSASLQVIKLLMADEGHLLLLGAYRDNEVYPAHPLMLMVDELQKGSGIVQTMVLQPLNQSHTNQLVAETLSCSLELAQPLTELVYRKTEGNPFFTTQFLRGLYEDGYITFDDEAGWQCDITQVRSLSLTNNIVEFMATQIQKLPEPTQRVLKLAACIGAQFDLNTLAIISEQPPMETAVALWPALQSGLILPITETYKFFQRNDMEAIDQTVLVPYRFLHDRVQQAAYSLIPEEQKQATHLKIGQRLLQHTAIDLLDEKIFEIVNQLNYGILLVTDPMQRQELARLNGLAGNRAKLATAYDAAYNYFDQGIHLLSLDCWQTQYALALELYVGAAESACLKTDFETMKTLCDYLLTKVTAIADQVQIYELLIFYHHTQSQFRQAVALAVQTLDRLGEPFPENPDTQAFLDALQTTTQLIQQVGFENLAHLPTMQDTHKLAAMRILRWSCYPAYFAAPEMLGLLVCRLVDVTLKYGNSPLTPFAFGIFSVLLNGCVGDIETGKQFGELAIALEQQQPNLQYRAVSYNAIYGLSRHFYKPVRECLEPLLAGYQSYAQNGDAESSAYCFINAYFCTILSGQNLRDVQVQYQKYIQPVVDLRQEQVIHQLHVWMQFVQNLVEPGETAAALRGEYFDIDAKLPSLYQSQNFNTINYAHTAQTMLAYLLGQYEQGLAHASTTEPHLGASAGKFFVSAHNFYYSLCLSALYTEATESVQLQSLEKLRSNQQKLKHWANHCPENFLHRFLLVEAEICRIQRQFLAAIDLYDRAIAEADNNGYVHESALAHELAARLYLDWGKDKVAAGYLQEAYYRYGQWGAKAKIDDLEDRYPNLLRPILQQALPVFNPLDTLASIAVPNFSIHAGLGGHHSSTSTGLNRALDFAAIFKAAQSLASTLQLDDLLKQLSQIILQNSGGDRCVLMLGDATAAWRIVSISTLEETQQCEISLDEYANIPVKLIQYVKNTQEVVIIDDLETDLAVLDGYLKQQRPQSVLCLPLLNQGQIHGILYLENQATCGVFTNDRILILNFLCNQAAIALANARLYQQLRESQQLLQLVFNTLPQRAFWKDRESRFLGCNNLFLQDAGLSLLDQIIGKSDFEMPWQADAEKYRLDDLAVMESGISRINFEEAQSREDGSVLWIRTSKIPLRNLQGEVIGVFGSYEDITPLKEAEELLKQQKQDLEIALDQLQQSQLQIVQNEKMASLGQLVAGIAHEINNPINFIYGNLKPAKDYIKDLLYLLDCYQKHMPNPPEAVLDCITEVDLEFLTTDLHKLMDSMKLGADRIRKIVLSLRNFSRLDESDVKLVDLHEGLDSTLLILQHRLKQKDATPAIQIVKEYGELPLLECYAGQLNQVFMNLLANAIDAIEEDNQSRSLEEIKENPSQITIKTAIVNHGQTVEIRIHDNGAGMTDWVQQKLFNHFFTTKEVGKGTGLGLAIAHQIIVEKHQGSLEVESELGQGTEFCMRLPMR